MKRLLCKIGIHDYEFIGFKFIIKPKRGPFDPTTEPDRACRLRDSICVHCGKLKLDPSVDMAIAVDSY